MNDPDDRIGGTVGEYFQFGLNFFSEIEIDLLSGCGFCVLLAL